MFPLMVCGARVVASKEFLSRRLAGAGGAAPPGSGPLDGSTSVQLELLGPALVTGTTYVFRSADAIAVAGGITSKSGGAPFRREYLKVSFA